MSGPLSFGGSHRFSSWDGTQDPLGPDPDEVFARLSEDVFQGWDFEGALRRLLAQGWRDAEGRRLPGLEEMTERLRQRRRRELERYNLEGIFSGIEEKLNRVLQLERRGIQDRLASAPEGTPRRVLERVARQRLQQLEELPIEPSGALRRLQDYEFMDRDAEEAFNELMDQVRRSTVDAHFRDLASRMASMSKQDLAPLKEMVRDLNRLARERLEGVPLEERQAGYRRFLERWGSMFPDAPASVDEFLDELRRQMARMSSLLKSLSPEMRRQLEELIEATFDDPEMNAEMAELGAMLGMLSPAGELGSAQAFRGGEDVSLEEAMRLMEGLQSMEELEVALRSVYRGGEIDERLRRALAEVLGEDLARSLDSLQQVTRDLERSGVVERSGDRLQLTARGMRRIGQKALGDLFSQLRRDRFGEHSLAREGRGGERADQSKLYEFGDVFDLDVQRTVMNAMRREAAAAEGHRLARPLPEPDDFEVHRMESLTRSATVLMLDMSRSMPLRGYFYAAKKVALALDALIRSQYPRDSLHVVGFARSGQEISPAALPQLSVDEYVYGTNLQHALMLARRLLARHPGGNKQVIIITDGEPTAHHDEAGRFTFQYPPLPETIHRTLVEVGRCTREGIVINTFMLESNHRLVDFVNRMTRINRGRAFFISPERLGDYVLVDFVRGRRRRAA